jgi:hypothetical protein
MATRALHTHEAQPHPKKRPFLDRLLTEPPQFRPMRKLIHMMTHTLSSIAPKDVSDLKKLFLEIHPEEMSPRIELDVFAAFSRVVVGARTPLLRKFAAEERESIPWAFRESLLSLPDAKEY